MCLVRTHVSRPFVPWPRQRYIGEVIDLYQLEFYYYYYYYYYQRDIGKSNK